MNRFVVTITVFLLIGLVLSDIHMVILKLYPQTGLVEKSYWLDKNHTENITLVWYIYELSNILNKVIWMFCFFKISNLVSHRLANVLMVFLFYHVTQLLFYVWNRNTLLFSNFIVYIYMWIAIIFLFIPAKKGGKLINLEDYNL